MVQTQCSPLEYDGQRMPIDCFHELWHTPGFKYEYGDGKVQISIQEAAAPIMVARPSMITEAVSETSAPEDVDFQGAGKASVNELKGLWLDSFVRTPDYHGYRVEDMEKQASKTLNPLYRDESPDLHPASVVALWNGNPVGMLLINKIRPRPVIDALGVRPDMQHRGVGSAMAKQAASSLHEMGEHVLCSGHLLANAQSAAWHEATGFIEIPDWLTTNHRFRCAQHNLEMGLVRDIGGMKRYVDMLRTELEDMRADQDEDPDAHCPFLWTRSDGDRIDDFLSQHTKQVEE